MFMCLRYDKYVVSLCNSGCITSAESILVSSQSHNDLLQVIESNAALQPQDPSRKYIYISLSPQSRASFAAKYNLSPQSVHQKLCTFLVGMLGVEMVLDISFTRDFALLESAKEFVYRFKLKSAESPLPMLASACPGNFNFLTLFCLLDNKRKEDSSLFFKGWICYAEKTQGHVIPYISTTKSPQQIMGSFVKTYIATSMNLTPDRIYHVSIMPCYDKKLEASRSDFYNDVYRYDHLLFFVSILFYLVPSLLFNFLSFL
jgi:iron only hydrogenase large subunit-like protein